MTVGDAAPQVAKFKLVNDPRTTATAADLVAQFEFLMKVRDRTTQANDAVKTIRNVRAQINDRIAAAPRLRRSGVAIDSAMARVEREIYQVKNQSGQDPLNYPVRLNNRIAALAGVAGSGPYRPTASAETVFTELSAALETELKQLQKILTEDLNKFNQEAKRAGQDPVVPKAEDAPARPVIAMDDDDMAA
jgi:predicted pyridoxine 5'-phosphate oxidase superfamily flavin-nucleotide-binding protein